MAQLQLRPFTIGEMLDAAFKIYRERFKTLVTVAAVIVVPLGIVQAILVGSITSDPDEVSAGLGISFGVVALLGAIVSMVATAALTLAVADAYLGEDAGWSPYVSRAFARIGPVVGASILFAIAVGIGLVLLIVPGVIIGAGLGVFMPALMVERLGATESLGRAWNLSSGHRGRVFGAWLVGAIIVFIANAIVSLIVAAPISSTGVVTQQLVGIVGNVLTTPFASAIVVVIYFDLRVRKEGFDLQMLSSQVDGTAPPASGDDFAPPTSDDGGDTWPPPAE